MSSNIPYSATYFMHKNLTNLVSTGENKFDIVDLNRIPYTVKYNRDVPNFISVGDENGYIKFFSTYPKLKPIKEFSAHKSCIYDMQWLNSHELACGGGDQFVSIYDANTCVRLAQLKGHTESVKSITQLASNPFVIATGSRDGSILIFDIRFNINHSSEPGGNPNGEPVSHIRSVSSIQRAHFVDNHSTSSQSNNHHYSSRLSNVLRSKQSNSINSSPSSASSSSSSSLLSSNLKRQSPVACVLFQNEYLLASAGATDGLIKLWDIRKLHLSKKSQEQLPLHILDNQLKPLHNSKQTYSTMLTPSTSKSLKGYSNLVFNNKRTHLYANCLNNFIYEFNFVTYNNKHTRIVNNCLYPSKTKLKTFNLNQSNFIKSSISSCDNFMLTGSSDFNAYIYSTNMNSSNELYRRQMPIIVLKGHTNEVTTVDWNPFDSNQLVTCSDDNTIRVWNVKHDIDELKSKECNFSIAETINEFATSDAGQDEIAKKATNDETCSFATSGGKQEKSDDFQSNSDTNTLNYVSTIRNYNRVYNKSIPNGITGVYDDFLFVRYECKNLLKKNTCQMSSPMRFGSGLSDGYCDLEKELCIKCENINIECENVRNSSSSNKIKFTNFITSSSSGTQSGASSSSTSPTSQIIKSMQTGTSGIGGFQSKINQFDEFKIIKFETPTSNLPINLIEKKSTQVEPEMDVDRKINEMMTTTTTNTNKNENSAANVFSSLFLFKRQSAKSTLLLASTSSTNSDNTKTKSKTLKRRAQTKQSSTQPPPLTSSSIESSKSPTTSPQNKLKPQQSDTSHNVSSQQTNLNLTPFRMLLKLPVSTSKKRNLDSTCSSSQQIATNNKEESNKSNATTTTTTSTTKTNSETKTPQTKRRLLMHDDSNSTQTSASTSSSSSSSSSTNHHHQTPSRTILHYFSPLPPTHTPTRSSQS